MIDTFSKMREKLADAQGDTIVEVLVALTIAALALTMLAISISTAGKVIGESRHAMGDAYALESTLAEASPTPGCQGSVTVTSSDDIELSLLPDGDAYSLSYSIADEDTTGLPIVTYSAEVNI